MNPRIDDYAYGRMSVDGRVGERGRALGIRLAALPTADAVQRFNETAAAGDSVAACFHLTC